MRFRRAWVNLWRWHGRGAGLLSALRGLIIVFIGLKVFNFPGYTYIPLGLTLICGQTLMGWIDEFFKIPQERAKKNLELNPPMAFIRNEVQRLGEEIDKQGRLINNLDTEHGLLFNWINSMEELKDEKSKSN